MLRFFGFIVMAVTGFGALLVLDYNITRKAAEAESEEMLTFGDYIGAFPERIAELTRSSASAGLPTALADMLPRAPEGWTVRPATKDDIDVFLPKKGAKAEAASVELVKSVGSTRQAKGAEVVILTYEKGDRRVVVQAIRHPDSIFTGHAARDRRFDLRMASATPRGSSFMTVRGLDVTEDFLGDGMRGRYFFASVGAQIQLRVLASRRMKDADLLPFFETLHVKALNASVVDRQEGLGEVPVIVLASALDKEERAAFDADRAARNAEAAARAREELAVAEAEAAAAARAKAEAGDGTEEGKKDRPKTGLGGDCAKGTGGIKRCSVGSGD